MRIAYFDCFSGISGDMTLGAFIDAGLSFKTLSDELAKLKIKNADFTVTKETIVETISKATKIPMESLSEQKTKDLDQLETNIRSRLFGQESAIDTVLEKIYVAKAGLKSINKPLL